MYYLGQAILCLYQRCAAKDKAASEQVRRGSAPGWGWALSAPPGREEEEEEEEETSCAMAAHGAGVLGSHLCGLGGRKEKEEIKSPMVGMKVGCSQGAQGRAAMRKEEHPKAG